MRSRISNIAQRAKLFAADMTSTAITLRWVVITGGTLDRITGETVGATSTPTTLDITGLVHFVGATKSGFRVHSEIQIGDAILDLDPDVAIDGKKDLIFEFAGKKWAQCEVGEDVAKSWDTVFGDQKLFRTVLVRQQA